MEIAYFAKIFAAVAALAILWEVLPVIWRALSRFRRRLRLRRMKMVTVGSGQRYIGGRK
jgi:hypothetical protein